MFPSRLRFRGGVRRHACRCWCRAGLSFLIATLAALPLAAVLAVLALPVLFLTVFGLTVLGRTIFILAALAVGAAAALARGEIGGRGTVVGADQNLGAVG